MSSTNKFKVGSSRDFEIFTCSYAAGLPEHDPAGGEWVGWCAGGRVTGREVIAELVQELRGSVAAAEQFEGEMRNLAAYAKALAQALDCIRSAGGNRSAASLYHNPVLPTPA